MAPPSSSHSSAVPPAGTRPSSAWHASPWALLWLGGISAAAWILLLLSDAFQPTPQTLGSAPRAPIHPPPGAPASRVPPLPFPIALTSQASAFLPDVGVPGLRPRVPLASSLVPLPSAPQAQALPSLGDLQHEKELPGSVLLGGPLGLDSLQEKAMVPAARIEQALRASSADRLAAVPLHWRSTMQALVKGPDHVLPAEVVRVPAPHLKTPEEYPMVVKADGMAETSITPPSQSKISLEKWAERQNSLPPGNVRPVIVVLEPVQLDSEPVDSKAKGP